MEVNGVGAECRADPRTETAAVLVECANTRYLMAQMRGNDRFGALPITGTRAPRAIMGGKLGALVRYEISI